MLALWLALALLWPLLIACFAAVPDRLSKLGVMWISAPLPALGLALLGGDIRLEINWWLLGGVWELDATRRTLLGLVALLWLLAGLYARGYLGDVVAKAHQRDEQAGRRLTSFSLLWPLTLAGLLLLIVAEDIASFYAGFTLMTFAAYGLVVNDGSDAARRGGHAYLIMALFGEGLILAGLLWAAGSSESLTLAELRAGIAASPHALAMTTLLWLGFGVKAGVVGLHVWLPLAHPVAPTPASAILSGAMIKAGLLGWIQILPVGLISLPGLGYGVVCAGLLAAVGAAVYGITQYHAKAVLAYSSISQMGMMTTLLGVGLIAPSLWSTLLPAMLLFALHHGLNKGALFLGVGITEHPPRLPAWLLWGLLILPGLSLTGAVASGMVAKWSMKEALYDGGWSWLVEALSWAAMGTTLLVARALWRQHAAWQLGRREGATPAPVTMSVAWVLCVLAAAASPWWMLPGRAPAMPPLGEWLSMLWPVLLGIGVALVPILWLRRRPRPLNLERLEMLPSGDLWHGYARAAIALRSLAYLGMEWLTRGSRRYEQGWHRLEERRQALLERLAVGEAGLRHLVVPAMVAVVLILWALLTLSIPGS
ncbi:hypothetical protein HIO72_05975 [Halomonas sp. PA5]|nr:hypothetical protein HIO72_05975 [Halomonas sp. PA5]